MIDPVSAKEMAAILTVFVTMTEKLGAHGLFGLIFGGPILLGLLFSIQGWVDRRHERRMSEEARKLLWELWEKHRDESTRMREEHRRETDGLLVKFGDSLDKTTRYYENNVILVQNYEKHSGELQTLVATTIRTLSRIDAHFDTLCRSLGK